KLNQELNLLSPQLQQLFSQDPTNFAVSNLPPELRALLDSQEPISTAVGVTAQIPVTGKFSFNPNVSVNRDTLGTQQRNWTSFFGYSLTYQLSRSLQLRSSLSSIWMAQTSRASMQRTTVFSAGMVKTFSGSPAHLLARRSRRTIQGRIYRDDNINGVFNRGEQGIAGVQVQLDGSETAVTDEQGLYRFSDVGGGVHRVSLALAQFPNPVRMTTTGEFEIDMDAPGMHSADFGIINFARLMGTVFNDLRFQGVVQPDSIGVGNVHLFLRKGGQTVMTVVIPPSGHFEEDNIAPGDYDLVVDENSIPANYSTNISAIPVHIAPVSTVVANLPLRAMRSISGHVFLSATNEASAKRDDAANKDKLVPLAGVHLAAGGSEATTGSDGAFVLRNLPAGELTVTLVPAAKLPDNLKLPAGRVQMPAEPVQIQNATIVLSNRELVPYLVRK
ncbi:MAG: SdrD B-like domain-containing protein, partial [Terriglobales bacterium]